jgi:hypothetical protein
MDHKDQVVMAGWRNAVAVAVAAAAGKNERNERTAAAVVAPEPTAERLVGEHGVVGGDAAIGEQVMGWQEVITKRRLGSDRFHEKSERLGCAGIWSRLVLRDRMLRECEQRPVEMFSDRSVDGAADVLVVTKLTLSISRSLSRCSVVPRGHRAGTSEAGHRRASWCVTLLRACSRCLDRLVSADRRTFNRIH